MNSIENKANDRNSGEERTNNGGKNTTHERTKLLELSKQLKNNKHPKSNKIAPKKETNQSENKISQKRRKLHESSSSSSSDFLDDPTKYVFSLLKSIPKSDKFRIFEVVGDGDTQSFKNYLDNYSEIIHKLLKLKTLRKRTLIHIAAYRGSVSIMRMLLNLFRTHEIKTNSKDKNGDTPLDLACTRGFDMNESETYTDILTGESFSKRFVIVRSLLKYKNKLGKKEYFIKFKKLRKGMNSPMHWAIYWSDIHLTNLVYEECRDQIFWTNSDNMTPFDMCHLVKTKLLEQKAQLVNNFLKIFLDYFLPLG